MPGLFSATLESPLKNVFSHSLWQTSFQHCPVSFQQKRKTMYIHLHTHTARDCIWPVILLPFPRQSRLFNTCAHIISYSPAGEADLGSPSLRSVYATSEHFQSTRLTDGSQLMLPFHCHYVQLLLLSSHVPQDIRQCRIILWMPGPINAACWSSAVVSNVTTRVT